MYEASITDSLKEITKESIKRYREENGDEYYRITDENYGKVQVYIPLEDIYTGLVEMDGDAEVLDNNRVPIKRIVNKLIKDGYLDIENYDFDVVEEA